MLTVNAAENLISAREQIQPATATVSIILSFLHSAYLGSKPVLSRRSPAFQGKYPRPRQEDFGIDQALVVLLSPPMESSLGPWLFASTHLRAYYGSPPDLSTACCKSVKWHSVRFCDCGLKSSVWTFHASE